MTAIIEPTHTRALTAPLPIFISALSLDISFEYF